MFTLAITITNLAGSLNSPLRNKIFAPKSTTSIFIKIISKRCDRTLHDPHRRC